MGPTVLLPFRRKACWGFFRPAQSWRLRSGLNPRTWVLRGSTLPLGHRSRSCLSLLSFLSFTVAIREFCTFIANGNVQFLPILVQNFQNPGSVTTDSRLRTRYNKHSTKLPSTKLLSFFIISRLVSIYQRPSHLPLSLHIPIPSDAGCLPLNTGPSLPTIYYSLCMLLFRMSYCLPEYPLWLPGLLVGVGGFGGGGGGSKCGGGTSLGRHSTQLYPSSAHLSASASVRIWSHKQCNHLKQESKL